MSTTRIRLTGAGPSPSFSLRLARAVQPTKADLLEVLARQQARILERTEKGVDYQGKPFAAYSTKGPYYYYPAGPVGRLRSAKERKGAKARVGSSMKGAKNGVRTRSGLGLRFASYSAFKRTYLGSAAVDLRGARAPHMLQQIVIQASQPSSGTIGIYGEAGARASGHNEGTRTLPQRRFFDASEQDIREATELLADRAAARLLAASKA